MNTPVLYPTNATKGGAMEIALVVFFSLFSAVSVPGIFSERYRWCWKGSRAGLGRASHLFAALLPLSLGLAILADEQRLPVEPAIFGMLACLFAAALGLSGGLDTRRASARGGIPPVKAIMRGGVVLVLGLLAFIIIGALVEVAIGL